MQGSQHCEWVGRGGQPPFTPNALPNTHTYTKSFQYACFPTFRLVSMDRPTDRRTDKASFRVACPQLKMWNVCLSVCKHAGVYAGACVYVCSHVCVCLHVCLCLRVFVLACVCAHACVCFRVFVCARMCMPVHVFVCMCVSGGKIMHPCPNVCDNIDYFFVRQIWLKLGMESLNVRTQHATYANFLPHEPAYYPTSRLA